MHLMLSVSITNVLHFPVTLKVLKKHKKPSEHSYKCFCSFSFTCMPWLKYCFYSGHSTTCSQYRTKLELFVIQITSNFHYEVPLARTCGWQGLQSRFSLHIKCNLVPNDVESNRPWRKRRQMESFREPVCVWNESIWLQFKFAIRSDSECKCGSKIDLPCIENWNFVFMLRSCNKSCSITPVPIVNWQFVVQW